MSAPWPCWECRWRSPPDTTGTYHCSRPIDTSKLAVWEQWVLKHQRPSSRTLGTEKQLRGDTPNDRPECNVMEVA